MKIEDKFVSLLGSVLKDTGRDAAMVTPEIRDYAMAQAQQLALGAGQPGFYEATVAAADNVMLRMALKTVDVADAADARVWGVVFGIIGAAT